MYYLETLPKRSLTDIEDADVPLLAGGDQQLMLRCEGQA